MARENYVMLIGEVKGSPVINEEKQRARFSLQTKRRTGQIDFPIVSVYGKDVLPKAIGLTEGDFVVLKGFLTTSDVKKSAICEHCSKKNVARGTFTEVVAIDIQNIGKGYELADWAEMSNNLMVLGTVCVTPSTRTTGEERVPYCQYQIALNRSFNVGNKTASSDYPWVKSIGEQARQDSLRLQKGSQVYIRGAIQTRNLWRNILCSHCNETFKAEDFVAEISPYSVEYLFNCIFPQKNNKPDEEKQEESIALSS